MSIRTIFQHLFVRTLSPARFASVQLRWRESLFRRQTARSWFISRKPVVHVFRTQLDIGLAHIIEPVNVLTRTDLCRIMLRSGSDKSYHSHNYTTIYSALFTDSRKRPLKIFELGLGSNNPAFAFHMGLTGTPGASLRGWREFFPHAQIYGADIDRSIQIHEDRIKTFYCDQLDQDSIRELWLHPELASGVDLIIEDGLHTFEGNTTFLEASLQHLKPNGTYVIEDISEETIPQWFHQIQTVYLKQYSEYEFVLTHLPTYPDVHDNNLLIIRRHSSKPTNPAPPNIRSHAKSSS